MTEPESAQTSDAAPIAAPPADADWRRRLRIGAVVVFLLGLAFGGWGLWRVLAPGSADVQAQLATSRTAYGHLQERFEELQQRVATLGRSDQISRDANRDVQGTLAERDEQIAGLRADLAFYERLVGATAQRRGLSVHALKMEPQSDSAWHFQTTLTQNLNRGAVSSGLLSLSIEGSRNDKLQTLDWDALRQRPDADDVDFSFKYFEQVQGDVFLPEGFAPVRVTVRLQPRSGASVEESFTWAEATGGAPPASAPTVE